MIGCFILGPFLKFLSEVLLNKHFISKVLGAGVVEDFWYGEEIAIRLGGVVEGLIGG